MEKEFRYLLIFILVFVIVVILIMFNFFPPKEYDEKLLKQEELNGHKYTVLMYFDKPVDLVHSPDCSCNDNNR